MSTDHGIVYLRWLDTCCSVCGTRAPVRVLASSSSDLAADAGLPAGTCTADLYSQ